MKGKDVAYYTERAAAERKLAAASENEDVAAIHEELARQYEALVEQASLRPTLRIVVPGEDSAGAGMGVSNEESAATQLGARGVAGGARSPPHPNQPS